MRKELHAFNGSSEIHARIFLEPDETQPVEFWSNEAMGPPAGHASYYEKPGASSFVVKEDDAPYRVRCRVTSNGESYNRELTISKDEIGRAKERPEIFRE